MIPYKSQNSKPNQHNYALRVNNDGVSPSLQVISIADWTLRHMSEVVNHLVTYNKDIFYQQDASKYPVLIEKLRNFQRDHITNEQETCQKIDELFSILHLT